MMDPTQPLVIDAPETKPLSFDVEEEDDKLNPKQELFCQYYATDKEFFGNGTQTYLEVYEPDKSKPNWYKSAQASASRLLSNVMVAKRINELLEAGGLNDQYVDKQLEFLITQHADFKSKLGAIREYNALKTRVIKRLDHTTDGEKIPEAKVIILDTRPSEGGKA